MNYKDYQSYRVKNGSIDVFVLELDGHSVVQMFMTDHLSHTTSSGTFTSIEHFKQFIEFLSKIRGVE